MSNFPNKNESREATAMRQINEEGGNRQRRLWHEQAAVPSIRMWRIGRRRW